MKIRINLLISLLVVVFAFGTALPAKAFYIEVPQILKDAYNAIKTSNASAEEGTTMMPLGTGTIFCDALGRQATINECGTATSQQPGSTSIFCDVLGKQTTKDECDGASSQRSQQPGSTIIFCDALGKQTTKDECNVATSQLPGSTIIFCDILGKRTTKDECPPSNNGSQQPQQNNQQMMNRPPQGQDQSQQNNRQMMGQNGQNGQSGQNGQGSGDNKNFLKDMQRGAKQLERSLAQFDVLLQATEKAGGTVSSDIKGKADKLRGMVEKIKAATSPDDLQDFDLRDAGDIAQELEQYRRDTQDQTQRLKQVKQQIRNAEQAIKSFEKQTTKAKDCVSSEVTTNLETLKTTIAAVKNAKTWDEVTATGLDDMANLFDNLNNSRDQLEICARWPQMLKQVDKQLKDLDRQVIKSKSLVDKLSAKGIDVSASFSAFESGVAKLKAVREAAVAKMQSNDGQGAFTLLQDDLFGQMDDVMQNQQTIQTMSNLGSFNAQFNRSVTAAQKQINTLKRQKIDTAELVNILTEAKAKGAEVLALVKQKDMNLDTVMADLGDLQDLNSTFSDKVAELTGDTSGSMTDIMGPSQFKTLQMPTGMNQFMSQPQPMQQPNSQGNNGLGF